MRYAIVAALAFVTSGCVTAEPSPDPFTASDYIDRNVAEAHEQKAYASYYPHALAPIERNAVSLKNPSVAQGPLLTTVDAEWNGTLDDLVRMSRAGLATAPAPSASVPARRSSFRSTGVASR